MTPPDSVLELVERFEHNRKAYRSGHYNETQVRREFIDPFFEALGWDVVNKQGYAEAYKDVVHEETLKVGGGTKAPDCGFRIGGARHDRMRSLVERMLDLNKRVAAEQVPHARTMLQRHVESGSDGSARQRRTRWCMSCTG